MLSDLEGFFDGEAAQLAQPFPTNSLCFFGRANQSFCNLWSTVQQSVIVIANFVSSICLRNRQAIVYCPLHADTRKSIGRTRTDVSLADGFPPRDTQPLIGQPTFIGQPNCGGAKCQRARDCG